MKTLQKINNILTEATEYQTLLATIIANPNNTGDTFVQAKEALDEINEVMNTEIQFSIEDDFACQIKELDMCLYKKPFFENVLRHI